jgi:hypothetical protein
LPPPTNGSDETGDGCAGRLSFAGAFLGGSALAIFFFAMGVPKQTDAYKTALARGQANPAVLEAIGSPISHLESFRTHIDVV